MVAAAVMEAKKAVKAVKVVVTLLGVMEVMKVERSRDRRMLLPVSTALQTPRWC